jgi:hypothetical protein
MHRGWQIHLREESTDMLSQHWIALHDTTAWNAALVGLDVAIAHTHAYQQAMAYSHGKEVRLYHATWDGGSLICPLLLRDRHGHYDAVTPYGFGGMVARGTYPEFAVAFHAFMASEGIVAAYLMLHPARVHPWMGKAEDFFSSHSIFLWDITPPAETLLAKMAQVHRYELMRWEAEKNLLVWDKPTLLAAIQTLYPKSLARQGAGAIYGFHHETLRELLMQESTIVVGVEVGGSIEAAVVMLAIGNEAEYFLSTSTEDGRSHTRGLIWHAVQALQTRGIMRVNLGGGVKNGDGLEQFKRRFGADRAVPMALKHIYQPQAYAALCEACGVSEERGGFFPPYQRR